MAWMIVREGDAEPEYFAGTIFSADDNWTRDDARAFKFLHRSTARRAIVDHGFADDPLVRIVPTWTPRDDR